MVLQSSLYFRVIVQENCFISLSIQTNHVLHKEVETFYECLLVTRPGIEKTFTVPRALCSTLKPHLE